MNNIDILEEFCKIKINSYAIKFVNISYPELQQAIETLIAENKELKEENKKLNIIRLEMLLSQFPDTTETYKKYKKELQSLLGKE